jgi:hypothetical protein
MEIADEIRLQARHVVCLFVHPDDPGEIADQFFGHGLGLEFRIGLEIEDQHVLSAKAFPARIDKL